MPNIAAVLKEEIARIARKEIKPEIDSLKKSVSSYRTQIAELKRRLQEQERTIRALSRASSNSSPPSDSGESTQQLRFSPARFAAQRKRLALSAEMLGRLIGTTGQTIYLWERGTTRPNRENLAAIAALRGIGKRALAKRLESLE